ncbi:(2Fe-2S)-binding protein [Longitalea arenae]|uniref:(2Fe-2S)-binding protein n=1 Tax=Longitalea arenae TaxID=2812558 RepID=UPI001967E071|nr:(2Fe-2S)-binding protein [Longitalea arenae]
MNSTIQLQVNGKKHTLAVDPATPLLYVLRDQLALNGPKYGCGLQQCGACMVLLNGKAEPSCLVPVAAVKDKDIITLEGLVRPDNTLHPVQEAFVEEQAAQCGYCMNGMVISAVALLNEKSQPSDAEIRAGLQRALCRCGTQSRIIKAVKKAAAKQQGK